MYGKEVDFVVAKDGRLVYLQVTDEVLTETTRVRELGPLRSIRDSHEKFIVVRQGRYGLYRAEPFRDRRAVRRGMRAGCEMLRNLGCLRKPSTAWCRLSSSRRARPSIRPHSLHSAIPLASPACGFPPASARALLSGNVALAWRLAALFAEPRLL